MGRKKLVIAALWSEMGLAQPAIHSMGLTGTSLDVDEKAAEGRERKEQ